MLTLIIFASAPILPALLAPLSFISSAFIRYFIFIDITLRHIASALRQMPRFSSKNDMKIIKEPLFHFIWCLLLLRWCRHLYFITSLQLSLAMMFSSIFTAFIFSLVSFFSFDIFIDIDYAYAITPLFLHWYIDFQLYLYFHLHWLFFRFSFRCHAQRRRHYHHRPPRHATQRQPPPFRYIRFLWHTFRNSLIAFSSRYFHATAAIDISHILH